MLRRPIRVNKTKVRADSAIWRRLALSLIIPVKIGRKLEWTGVSDEEGCVREETEHVHRLPGAL